MSFSARAQRRSRRGFTLIELLVAISILAIVAVLGWRGLDGIIRARVALTSDMEQLRGMQLAFAQLQSDCSQVVSSTDFPEHPTVVVQDGGITLMRSVAYDQQAAQFEIVSYRYLDGKLTRQESAASRNLVELDQAWQAALSGAGTGRPVLLESGLSFMATRVMQEPPVGLEVVMTLKGHQNSVTKVFLVGPV